MPGREGLFYSAGDPMSGRAVCVTGRTVARMERPPWMQRLAPLYVVALRIALAAALIVYSFFWIGLIQVDG